MADLPLVSIITLNFNQTAATCAFLESTKTLTYPRFEIIVIDNGSAVDPTEQIEAGKYPHTRLIIAGRNLGFTGGNNLGMQKAKGEYIFLVNDDTEVTPDLLEKLLAPFERDEWVGVVSPKIKFYDHPTIIQYAGFRSMNPFTGRTGAEGNQEVDRGQHDTSGETYGAHGAAMMIKREVIEKVGTFADIFFLYYEEWDWSARIRRAGYKIFYQAEATIYHKESLSIGKASAVKTYYLTRNRILYMRRNSSRVELLAFFSFLVCFSIPKALICYTCTLRFKHLRAFIRGVAWNVKHPLASV